MSPISSESPLKEIEKEIIFDSRYKRYTDYINPEGSTSEVVTKISFLVILQSTSWVLKIIRILFAFSQIIGSEMWEMQIIR